MRIVRLWRRWCPALRFVDNNGSPFEDNGRATSSNAIQWQEIFFACNVVRPMAAVHGHEALPSLMHDPYDAVIESRLLMQQISSYSLWRRKHDVRRIGLSHAYEYSITT